MALASVGGAPLVRAFVLHGHFVVGRLAAGCEFGLEFVDAGFELGHLVVVTAAHELGEQEHAREDDGDADQQRHHEEDDQQFETARDLKQHTRRVGRAQHGSFPERFTRSPAQTPSVSRTRRSTLVGLFAGLLALALFGRVVGYRRLLATVSGLDPLPFAAGFVAAVAALGCQFLALHALLDVRPSLASALGYLRGVYGRQLIPVGNVAGPVLIAYSMRRATGVSTDRGLPATIIAQAAAFLASSVVALVGSALLVAGGRRALLPLVGVFGLVVLAWVAVLAALVAGVEFDRVVQTVAAAVRRTLGRLSARVAARTERDVVQQRLDEFDDARRLIREDPGRVGVALVWATVGWTLYTLPAVTTGAALETPIPLAVAFVAVPVSDLLNALPVPGGIGGVEVAMAGIIVALTGVDIAAAAVIAFCVRLCTYWFVMLFSGTATTLSSMRTVI